MEKKVLAINPLTGKIGQITINDAGQMSVELVASEAIGNNKFVNIFESETPGIFQVRLANPTEAGRAHGFVTTGGAQNDTLTVYLNGKMPLSSAVTGLTDGMGVYLGLDGDPSAVPSDADGFSQQLGVFFFNAGTDIYIEVNIDNLSKAGISAVEANTLLLSDRSISVVAGEAIGGNSLVNIYEDGGVRKVRHASADAAKKYPANAFAFNPITQDEQGDVILFGKIDGITGGSAVPLTGNGTVLFLSETDSLMTETAPTTEGAIRQKVGFSITPSLIVLDIEEAIEL